MPVPIPGLKVGSDSQKVEILTISGRPKTGIFHRFRGVPGGPNPVDMDTLAARTSKYRILPQKNDQENCKRLQGRSGESPHRATASDPMDPPLDPLGGGPPGEPP
jgi:hypothetical protein